MSTRLPDHVSPYKRTPVFSTRTVPAALLRDHATKAGVWGLIHVVRGALILRDDSGQTRLEPGRPGVIEPEVAHAVEPVGDVSFFVEFWH